MNDYGLELSALLELVRQTEGRPFEGQVVQFMTSREEFYRQVKKITDRLEAWKKKINFDKMLVFGEWNGVPYYRIIFVKYIK